MQAKRLGKKHRSLSSDLQTLFDQLIEEPRLGIEIKPDVYKIRLAIKSKGRGKSSGARVITYVEASIIEEEELVDINLITIYDKSETKAVQDNHIQLIIDELPE